MASVFPVVFWLAIVAALMVCAALFTPKGPQQVVVRTSIMLALASCYLMWMITYMAQLHPLICACCTMLGNTVLNQPQHQ
ncbi:ATP synthase subunit H-domain-containing protein [Schizophyllum fasciatum]